MPAPMDDHELRRYLEAFADGELDVETNLRVLERMAMNPEATQRVMHQQELRKLAGRAMREQVPAVPADLRAKIESMAAEAKRQADQRRKGAVIHRIRRWMPALAAMVLLAVGLYLILTGGTKPATPSDDKRPSLAGDPNTDDRSQGAQVHLIGLEQPTFRDDLVEPRRVTAMGTRHEACSGKIDSLYRADDFSTVLSEVPAKITKYLGDQIHVPVPDLTALGYEYRGTGACSLPGGKAVHLVYRPIDSVGRSDSLSLWIRSDESQQVKIEEGRLYTVTPEGSVHPVLVWRRGGAVYYLVGERSSLMREAADSLYASR